jgi:hypothetical protein
LVVRGLSERGAAVVHVSTAPARPDPLPTAGAAREVFPGLWFGSTSEWGT